MTNEQRHYAALASGYKLHWYEIESILGQGGFGITYLAIDTNLDTQVAIKEFLPNDLAVRTHDSSVQPISEGHRDMFTWGLSRFLAESKTLARFQHPNIVRVYSGFEANNTAYMVMEYVEGQTLEAALKSRRLRTEQQLLDIVYPLLDGLGKIHAAGFIHRDIKPENIYLREDGSPLLIDFGSARQAIGAKTRTLTALVSPGYAPFEQYGGASKSEDRQGPWTDIYALGATLYRAVSGKAPMDAMARVNAVVGGASDAVSPAVAAGEGIYSTRFLEAIDNAIAFLPEKRPQTIAAWRKMFPATAGVPEGAQSAVVTVLPGASSPTASRPSRHARSSMVRWLATAVIAAALAGGVYVIWPSIESLLRSAAAPVPIAYEAPAHQEQPRKADRARQTEIKRQRLAEEDARRRAVFEFDTDMVRIEGGCFQMGSPIDEKGRGSDEGKHRVCVDDFAIGPHEVTVEAYDRFAQATGRRFPDDQGWGRGRHPIIDVSWEDAMAYAEWLSGQTGKRYRLPTEAEWEYAARAGTSTAYPWGDTIGSNRANCDGCGSRWDNSRTAPVGSFAPNAWGLYDTVGNVFEWTCSDDDKVVLEGNIKQIQQQRKIASRTMKRVDDRLKLAKMQLKRTERLYVDGDIPLRDYKSAQTEVQALKRDVDDATAEISKLDTVKDKLAAQLDEHNGENPCKSASATKRVGRGGSWHNFPRLARSATRRKGPTLSRGYDLGFRLARNL